MSNIKIIRDTININKVKLNDYDIELKDGTFISKEYSEKDSIKFYNFCGMIDDQIVFIKSIGNKVDFMNTFYNEHLENLIYKLFLVPYSTVHIEIMINFKNFLLKTNISTYFLFMKEGKQYTIRDSKLVKLATKQEYSFTVSSRDKMLILNKMYIPWFELFI